MFWVCLISHLDTSLSARTLRDLRSGTLATERTVTKNWRPNRLRLRLKEASNSRLETATSFSRRDIFSRRLNVENLDICHAELRARGPIFCFVFGVCTTTGAVHLSATFLAIPAEDKDLRKQKILFHTDGDFTCHYFFCEGMLMF